MNNKENPRNTISGVNRTFGREITNMGNKSNNQDQPKLSLNRINNSKPNLVINITTPASGTIRQRYKPNSVPPTKTKDSTKHALAKLISNKTTENTSNNTTTTSINNNSNNIVQLEKVDQENLHNPQYTVDYIQQIFKHLRSTEDKNTAKPGLMIKIQTEITEKMRGTLIDWIIDIHQKMKLLPETLFLTVNIIDRYLSISTIIKQKLQLVGITSLLIACKFEEIIPPEFKDFLHIVDKLYNKEDILDMEGKILVALNINLLITSPLKFLERYGRIASFDDMSFIYAKYILEISLLEYKMLKYNPSQIACSAIYIVNKYLKKEPWTDTLSKSCKYTECQLKNCVKSLYEILYVVNKGANSTSTSNNNLQALKKKYSQTKYGDLTKVIFDKI